MNGTTPEELEDKMGKLKRPHPLQIIESPPSASFFAKQDSLGVDQIFEFGKGDPMKSLPHDRPGRFDVELASVVVHGKIPPEIDGTFYRIICDSIYANRNGKDIWINGDGAVDAWRISNGVVDFKQKYVRSPRYIIERAARKPLWGTYRNPFSGDERVFNEVQSPGNTHIHYWRGLLLAIKEDSPPFAIDPDTLDTIGIYDFEGQLTSKTWTAHQKVDYKTGDMIGYGTEATGIGSNDVVYYRFNKHGKKVDECWFKTPTVTWTHEFGITDNYAIYCMTPFETDMEYMKNEAGVHFRFNRYLPNTFAVIPRYGPKPEDVRYFTTVKNHFFGHISNSFEGEDGCIYIDTFLSNKDTLGVFPNMHPELDAGKPERQLVGKFVRFKIDPKAPSTEMELPVILSELPGEMARCDDRYIGKPYQHAYGGTFGGHGFTGIVHINTVTGVTKVWQSGDGVMVSEPQFIPRSPESAEGDGYLLVSIRDPNNKLASAVLLDATKVEEGPLCIMQLPFMLAEGVHGNWVNTRDMPVSRPLVDYSGVTPEIMAEFATGAPRRYDELIGKPVKFRW